MKIKSGLSEETIQKLQSLFQKHTEIQSVTLYGSRAMGTYKNGSDIDLTIHAPDWSLTELLRLENEIDDLLLPYKVDLSLDHQIENQELLEHIQRVGEVFYRKACHNDSPMT